MPQKGCFCPALQAVSCLLCIFSYFTQSSPMKKTGWTSKEDGACDKPNCLTPSQTAHVPAPYCESETAASHSCCLKKQAPHEPSPSNAPCSSAPFALSAACSGRPGVADGPLTLFSPQMHQSLRHDRHCPRTGSNPCSPHHLARTIAQAPHMFAKGIKENRERLCLG